MAHAIIKINGGNLRNGGSSSEEFASVSTAPVHILPSFFLDNDKVAAFSASFALTSRASHKGNPARKGEGKRNVIKAYKAEVQYTRRYDAFKLPGRVAF